RVTFQAERKRDSFSCSSFERVWLFVGTAPPSPKAGLYSTSAFGIGEIAASSPSGSNVVLYAAKAAQVPPADPPPARSRSGSIPRRRAFRRIHRIALFASSTLFSGPVWWRFLTRYSAEAATMPRLARYSALVVNWAGEPPTNPPPKKKT